MPELDVSELSFRLTLHGGNVKDLAQDALTAVKEGKEEEAEGLLANADRELAEGHELQAEVMKNQDQDNPIYTNMFLAHALDHLMSAESELRLTKELVELYKKVEE